MKLKDQLKRGKWKDATLVQNLPGTANAVSELRKGGESIMTHTKGPNLLVVYLESLRIEDRTHN